MSQLLVATSKELSCLGLQLQILSIPANWICEAWRTAQTSPLAFITRAIEKTSKMELLSYSSVLFWYIPSKRYIKIYGRKKQYVLGGSSSIRAWIQCLLHIVMKKKHFMTRGNIPGFWYWSLTHNFSSFGFSLLEGDIQEFVEKRVVKFHIFK